MAIFTSKKDIAILETAGELLSQSLVDVMHATVAGASTKDIDRIARAAIERRGGQPIFLGYRGFPATICISVNDEVVHGIPGDRILQDGDIVGLDLGLKYRGVTVDSARTIGVGSISTENLHLLAVTRESLRQGVAAAKVGKRIGDIGAAIQSHVESHGFGIVRDLVGHGVGREVHEEPAIPNYGVSGEGELLEEGLVIAIEPMVTMGSWKVKTLRDGWTVVTQDHTNSAHFEQTVILTRKGPKVVTPFLGEA